MDYEESVTVNRKHKDKVFCMLYRDKKKLLSLYNAVNETNLTEKEKIEIITLENAVFMGMNNDVAFLVNFYMNLYEHQSTKNPNMPYRFLQYVAKEYEKIVVGKSMYASTPIKIPTPQFVVFYNGEENEPEKAILKLSDVYEIPTDNPELELKVTVYNINAGKNQRLMDRCQSLREYSLFVAKVREKLKKAISNDKQVKEKLICEAVDECIKEGILKDFLQKNKAEVIAMSIFEYDEEKEKELLRKAEFENGVKHGIQQERANTLRAEQEAEKARQEAEQAKLKAEKLQKILAEHNIPVDDED